MSLPPLDSESSSESLGTFRNVIAAENEAEIYQRIRLLENQQYFRIPPQTAPGNYERLVRSHFDQALDVDHFREIWDREYFELQVLERKGLLQERLYNLMLGEPNIDRILEISPYPNIREEAFHFIQGKLEPVDDLRHAFQRNLMDGSLHLFIQELYQEDDRARHSELYREFYREFTNEDLRRLAGLPIP